MDRRHEAHPSQLPTSGDRRKGDRRSGSRLSLSLEIAVPVQVDTDLGPQRGLARNISEGGMLIEVEEAPPIGSRVRVTINGIRGSSDAPDAITLDGEVRHHLAWQYTRPSGTKSMRGIGIRFVEPVEERPLTDWVWSTGHTVH
ncbi:MAG: PilZ domain-containing protein [Deltaproteobacteria bacterium]|jgi:c-di-GMP-binding flagellar brake protein YcgR